MQYYAKSANNDGLKLTVQEHLAAVAALAKKYGDELGFGEAAAAAGYLHDFGKYTIAFQDLLAGKRTRIDHAIGGAMYLEAVKKGRPGYRSVIEAVNGHHDGLVEYDTIHQSVYSIASGKTETSCNSGKTSSIQNTTELSESVSAFHSDFPNFKLPRLSAFAGTELESMLDTRMLFSCLVDADYSASAQNDDPGYLERTTGSPLNPEILLQNLYSYRNTIRQQSKADAIVNHFRDSVFEQCGEMGRHSEGLFTLTAPTGTGKTLALLHFALQHCLCQNKKRIIIVLPFLTLAEQNAAVYSKIIPDVLVDHSQSDLTETSRELASRWSSPVIITTSVRFFESLFSNRPTVCRKLHHIANSVVVFDEAQSLPAELTPDTLRAVNALCKTYHTTMVFSTATQPNYSAIRDLEWLPQEILPDHTQMFEALQRVEVDWRTKEETPLLTIAQEMTQQDNVCTIVNLRRHARTLTESLLELCPHDEVFYLTTDLCPAHRSQVIQAIRTRLTQKLPCRVVATQCIEAGVDLDFAVLYRALAPLDAIIQAAGRCNRNGALAKGQVIVFMPEDSRLAYPDERYKNAAINVLEMNPPFSIHDPKNIQQYYQRFFASLKGKSQLRDAIASRSFAETAENYKLIANAGAQVIVPYSGEREKYDRVSQALRKFGVTGALLKEAAPITVTCFAKELAAYAEPISFANAHHQEESRIYLLLPQYEHLYTENLGLHFQQEERNDFIF